MTKRWLREMLFLNDRTCGDMSMGPHAKEKTHHLSSATGVPFHVLTGGRIYQKPHRISRRIDHIT